MPAELLQTLGSVAMLLNPTSAPVFEPEAGNSVVEEAGSDHFFGDWKGVRTTAATNGFGFTIQYIGEVQGNVSGGSGRKVVYTGLLNVALDGDLEKICDWPGAKLHAAMLFPHGHSLTDSSTCDLFRLSNLDASADPRLFELWFEQNFFADKLSIRLGQMAADQEFAFTEQGALFINSAFGWTPIAGGNLPAPVYPQGAPGVRVAWHPVESCYAQAAVFDGDPNPLDASGRPTNPNGVNFGFDEGALLLGEMGCRWTVFQTALPGSAKVGGCYHTARFDHERWDAGGLSLADPAASGNSRQLRGDWAVYFAAEQMLWRKSSAKPDAQPGVGVFTRLGFAPPDRNCFQFTAEAGVTGQGLVPHREQDECGVAVAFGQISRDERELARDDNAFSGLKRPLPDCEIALEATYRIAIRSGWGLQPGLQYIIHPGGSMVMPDALVLGLRTQFDF